MEKNFICTKQLAECLSQACSRLANMLNACYKLVKLVTACGYIRLRGFAIHILMNKRSKQKNLSFSLLLYVLHSLISL